VGRFGKYMTLPDLLVLLVKCERDGKLGTACGAYYVEFVPTQAVALFGTVCSAGALKSVEANDHVPVEEPSTASIDDIDRRR
jgi:hypothetical protein